MKDKLRAGVATNTVRDVAVTAFTELLGADQGAKGYKGDKKRANCSHLGFA